jgi:hypothetical protein
MWIVRKNHDTRVQTAEKVYLRGVASIHVQITKGIQRSGNN